MSETILDHGYVPEEHAPDPVISHGDPTPPGKVAVWLFLASEIMFFIGVLGSYIVIRSGWPHLFEQHGKVLSIPLAGANTLVLIFSSLTMALAVDAAQKNNRPKLIKCLLLTFLCACTFMVIKGFEYASKFTHYTVVVNEGGQRVVYDGHLHKADGKIEMSHALRLVLADDANFNINFASPEWMHEEMHRTHAIGSEETPKEGDYTITGTIAQEVSYGPWKSLFFSCYFAATGIHGVHVIGGMIPLFILAVQAWRGRILPQATEYVGLYWHFVDLVWIFLFPLMYLI